MNGWFGSTRNGWPLRCGHDVHGQAVLGRDPAGDGLEFGARLLERPRRRVPPGPVDPRLDRDAVVEIAAADRSDEERLAADVGIEERPRLRRRLEERDEAMGGHHRVRGVAFGQQLVSRLARAAGCGPRR